MKRYYKIIKEDPVWSKLVIFSFVVFLLRMADAIVSFWAPNLIQSTYQNPATMGLIISLQSVVGIVADLVFPSLLKKFTVKNFMIWSVFASGATTLFLLFASVRPMLIFFLISMVVWGIYYELETFGITGFMAERVPTERRSGSWGIIEGFKSFAYFLGPFIAALLIARSNILLAVTVFIFLIVALFIYCIRTQNGVNVPNKIPVEAKPWQEIKYWLTLSKAIWPAILITLILGFIDATFWTTGAVLTVKLAKINPLGSLFLPLYALPSLFAGFLIVKWGIYKGKKKWAEKFMFLSSIFLIALIVSNSVIWLLLMVFISSIATSISYPLIDGVYTDITVRLGKEKKHAIGLESGIVNIAYIIWPPIAGIISGLKGEKMTFVFMGVVTLLVSILLLVVTPKKLKLPQDEIGEWK